MLRILVVDDSPTSRAIAARLIGDSYAISVAASGQEALDALASGDFDVVLLDLLMPGMDGYGVLAELRRRNLRASVVIMTADIQESTKSKISALGADGIVNKPLTREKLVAAIEAIPRGPGR